MLNFEAIALILSTKLIFPKKCFSLLLQHLRQFSCFFSQKNEVLRKFQCCPLKLKSLWSGLWTLLTKVPNIESWCAASLLRTRVFVGYNIEIVNYEKQSFNTTASFLCFFWKLRIKFWRAVALCQTFQLVPQQISSL